MLNIKQHATKRVAGLIKNRATTPANVLHTTSAAFALSMSASPVSALTKATKGTNSMFRINLPCKDYKNAVLVTKSCVVCIHGYPDDVGGQHEKQMCKIQKNDMKLDTMPRIS